MELVITEAAQKWFESELGLDTGDSLRIFGKYGGSTDVHVGFSTGIEVTKPNQPLVQVTHNGVVYFTESADEWFFAKYVLTIDLDDTTKEPSYSYTEK